MAASDHKARGPIAEDLTGKRFGRLVVLSLSPTRGRFKQRRWVCRCDCGTERTIEGGSLKGGRSRSCGCFQRERVAEVRRNCQRVSVAKSCAYCGTEFISYPSARRRYCSQSCGARGRTDTPTHRESRTRLYRAWCSMKARCKPGSPCSRYYSDRGIAVCPEWERSYEAFRDWAIGAGYADHLELDRIDNDRGYAPDNCRWATRTQQMRNTGKRRNAKTSRYKGVSWCANARKWRAQLGGDRGVSHIGYFADEVAAARAYDEAAIAAFGDFANTNFSERGRDAEPA